MDIFEKQPHSLKKKYHLENFSDLCICQRIIPHKSESEYVVQTKKKKYASSNKPHQQFGLAFKLQRNKSEFEIQLCLNRVRVMFKKISNERCL